MVAKKDLIITVGDNVFSNVDGIVDVKPYAILYKYYSRSLG